MTNHPSPFDAAWRTRIPVAWGADDRPEQSSEPARRIGSSDGWAAWTYRPPAAEPEAEEREEWPGQSHYQSENLQRYGHVDDAHVKAWRQSDAYQARPFRFEDLNGAPEPAIWGPTYPKTASAAVEKWRKAARGRELTEAETCLYGQAVHAWIASLNAPKRAPGTLSPTSICASGQAGDFSAKKHRAKLEAAFHAQCAADKRAWASGGAKDSHGRTIDEVYELVMKAKRSRLERKAA